MYLLDTNILSEIMRPKPNKAVAEWLAEVSEDELCTATICEAEIGYGIARLAQGQKRTWLAQAASILFETQFANRIFAFDRHAAKQYGTIRAMREATGKPIMPEDAMIGAIAKARNITLVTRNVKDFDGLGITVINPWDL